MTRILTVILTIVLASSLVIVGCSGGSSGIGTTQKYAKEGELAPDFKLEDINGKSVSLESFRGQPVLINFWATYCGPCVDEMPLLQQVYDERSGDGLAVLVINSGEDAIVAGGFMGSDTRSISEIIESDSADIARLGFTISQVVTRMKEITDKAILALGNWTQIDQDHLAKVDEAKGSLICPWPHPGRFAKRVTTVKLIEANEPRATCHEPRLIKWSDLNIHLIDKHGFFEGRGAAYRIEPMELVKIIF